MENKSIIWIVLPTWGALAKKNWIGRMLRKIKMSYRRMC